MEHCEIFTGLRRPVPLLLNPYYKDSHFSTLSQDYTSRSAARTSTCRTRRRRRRHENSAGSGENRTGLRASSCAQAEGGNARGERGPRGAWGARVRRRRRRAPPRWRARTAVSPAAQGARTPARAPIRALCPHPVAHTLSSRASVSDLPAGGAEDARVVAGGRQAHGVAEERGPSTRASVVLLWRRRGSRARGGGVWGRGGHVGFAARGEAGGKARERERLTDS